MAQDMKYKQGLMNDKNRCASMYICTKLLLLYLLKELRGYYVFASFTASGSGFRHPLYPNDNLSTVALIKTKFYMDVRHCLWMNPIEIGVGRIVALVAIFRILVKI